MEDSYKFNIEKAQIYKVKILDESNVSASRCSSDGNCEKPESGTWNILFDQALLIELKNLRFIANFQYTIKKGEDYKIVDFK